jgi:hypothetical protein
MLTIFSIPKAFQDHVGIIQRNAIQSWSRLRPAYEIVLCGDDPGTAEAAAEFDALHIPDIELNEFGTPLLHSAFEKVAKTARRPVLCYVNADIIFLSDFPKAIDRIPFSRYLMVGQRWDVDITTAWDFNDPDWEKELRQTAQQSGTPNTVYAFDYFVFPPDGVIEKLPPFAVGRPMWDRWFFYRARKELRIPTIDASRAVQAIHQNHEYAHVPKQRGEKSHGPEADRNFSFMKNTDPKRINMRDATHVVTSEAVLPARKVLIREIGYFDFFRRRLVTLQIFMPRTKPLVVLIVRIYRLTMGRLVNARKESGSEGEHL